MLCRHLVVYMSTLKRIHFGLSWPACWWRYFCPMQSHGSCLFQRAVEPQKGSHGHRNQSPAATTSCTTHRIHSSNLSALPPGTKIHLGSHSLEHCPQNPAVTLDTSQVTPVVSLGLTGKSNRVADKRPEEPLSSLHNIPSANPWQSTNGQTSQGDKSSQLMGVSVPCSRESPTTVTHCFLLAVMCGSGSAAWEAPQDSTQRSPSATRAINLFCRSAFLLVGGIISFQPPSWQQFLISQVQALLAPPL